MPFILQHLPKINTFVFQFVSNFEFFFMETVFEELKMSCFIEFTDFSKGWEIKHNWLFFYTIQNQSCVMWLIFLELGVNWIRLTGWNACLDSKHSSRLVWLGKMIQKKYKFFEPKHIRWFSVRNICWFSDHGIFSLFSCFRPDFVGGRGPRWLLAWKKKRAARLLEPPPLRMGV